MTHTKESRQKLTPDEILEQLKEGNKRFVSENILVRNYHEKVQSCAKGQYPVAIILNCIDSRISSEIIFDQDIGNIFCVRIAGNVLNADILGSMEFACASAGAKLILVLGHSNCAAVKSAIDGVEMGSLTGLLSKIYPAMDAVSSFEGEKNSANEEYMQKVAHMNVILTMDRIRRESEILREIEESGQIKIAGGMYDLSTGEVEFYE